MKSKEIGRDDHPSNRDDDCQIRYGRRNLKGGRNREEKKKRGDGGAWGGFKGSCGKKQPGRVWSSGEMVTTP